ncbi:MAG: hypothetical protein DA328_05225 [Nitrososphaeraceae archaeon]|nr:hypothetical protein [Nitrososphaeraceae archaeon]
MLSFGVNNIGISENMAKIAIIGSGVVGTATGKGFHRLGNDVTFYDISKKRMLSLKAEGYKTAGNTKDAISNKDIAFVCVNTPTLSDGSQDLSQVKSALAAVTDALNSIEKYPLIVFRSTMLPGTMRKLIVDFMEKNCILRRGKDYNICYNPEFLRETTALDDFFIPDRVIIGEDIKGSSKPLQKIYESLTENIIITNFEEAEMIKYTSNCFLSLKISFFNEIGMICKQMGLDDKKVGHAVSLDKRIGKYGTVPGKPFDGMCLPKDTEALSLFIRKMGWDQDLLKVTLDINKKIEELTTTKARLK